MSGSGSGGFEKGHGKVLKGSSEHKTERRRYLGQLIDQFQKTKSTAQKIEILANFANFSYDPYNYEFFINLDIISLFLTIIDQVDQLPKLNEKTLKMIECSLSGLVNCSPDIQIGKEIIKYNGIELIRKYITNFNSKTDLETFKNLKISAITILMFLIESQQQPAETEIVQTILTSDLKDNLSKIVNNCNDYRLKNVANVFLAKYFTDT